MILRLVKYYVGQVEPTLLRPGAFPFHKLFEIGEPGGGGTVYVRPTSASFVLGANNTYTGGTVIENSCLTVDTGGTLGAHTAYLCLVPFLMCA
ncbi:MAG: hypothetical protein C0485_03610 [Pirellula sp.]|nr:hypothetical protein [Pirellula sp.]